MGCPYDVSKKNNTRKMDVQAYYSEKLKHIDFKLNQLTSKVLFYSLTRLALFFVGILTIYYCNNNLLSQSITYISQEISLKSSKLGIIRLK